MTDAILQWQLMSASLPFPQYFQNCDIVVSYNMIMMIGYIARYVLICFGLIFITNFVIFNLLIEGFFNDSSIY